GTTSPLTGTDRSCGRGEGIGWIANPSYEGAGLRLDGVSFSFGGKATLCDVSLELPPASFFALLGASGSGKTTLLKLIGGYLTPAEGRIVLSGRDITDLPPERRNVGMVFQSYALFPHLTARGNVAFGLEVRGASRPDRQRRVEEAFDRVGLAS